MLPVRRPPPLGPRYAKNTKENILENMRKACLPSTDGGGQGLGTSAQRVKLGISLLAVSGSESLGCGSSQAGGQAGSYVTQDASSLQRLRHPHILSVVEALSEEIGVLNIQPRALPPRPTGTAASAGSINDITITILISLSLSIVINSTISISIIFFKVRVQLGRRGMG